ncbi:Uncharacterised protein [Aggregatibacter aphrophilus]|uniref:DUF6396 domain-containing protein n=1 Tax=Aggregatibacter aphrophilus TaxID=732 RepID=A0A336NBR9_AGGAP|nr:Uncharacterised protein [Aggregatibacter aphrophilus]
MPLPPAKLPEWDGKIAFQRWYEGEAPPKPSEALMQKLANQAGLRVDNGLDLETNLPKSVKNNKILTALYMFKVRFYFEMLF